MSRAALHGRAPLVVAVEGDPLKTKISGLRITPVAFPDPPLLSAFGAHQPMAIRTIVELVTDSGPVGLAETYGDKNTIRLLERYSERIAGVDVFALNRLQSIAQEIVREHASAFEDSSARTARATAAARLYSPLEVAALDVQGKLLGMRVCDLLGGAVRDAVPFSAYLFYKFAHHANNAQDGADRWGEAVTPEGIVRQAEATIERHGFKSIKLKGGVFEPAAELEAIRQLRARFPDCPLRIDPNGNWTVETALDFAPKFAPFLEYLEDPVLSYTDMARIQAAIPTPLATNMCVTAFEHLPRAIAAGSVKIILSDHHYWGGLHATQHLAQICTTWGLGLSMHSNSHLGISLMAMTHIAASVPHLSYACDTHYPWLEDDILAGGPITFDQGAVRLPQGPGLGIALDHVRLRVLADNYVRAGIDARDDVTEMRKHRPDWSSQRPRF